MFSLQWQIALILVLMLFPVTADYLLAAVPQRITKEELSCLNSTLQENIVGIMWCSFRWEQFNAQLFRSTNQHYIREVDKTFHDSAVSATLEWIALVAIAAVLWLVLICLAERLTLVLHYIHYLLQRLFDPLRQFAEKFTAIQAGFTAVERVDILNEPIEIRDPDRTVSREWRIVSGEAQAGEIRFEHVWFAYKDDDYVIKDPNHYSSR